MPDQWYCNIDGATTGPFTRAELEFLAARGKLRRSDGVRDGQGTDWTPARSVAGLFPIARTSRKVERATSSPPPESCKSQTTNEETYVTNGEACSTPERRLGTQSPPPLRPPASSRKRVLIGAGIGAGVLLLILLLLLLLNWPEPSPTAIAGGHGTAAAGAQGAKTGDGDALSTTDRAATTTAAGTQLAAAGEVGGIRGAEPNAGAASSAEEVAPPRAAVDRESPQPAESALADESPSPNEPFLFAIQRLKPQEPNRQFGRVAQTGRLPQMFANRTAEDRAEMVRREGGTAESERAVKLGLEWLARHQHEDGRWGLRTFPQCRECNGRCQNPGTDSDVAGTAMALMAFLGAGETHLNGEYCDVVKPGLLWLVEDQAQDGSFRHTRSGNMYAHGQAAIALCEALAMTGDEGLRPAAQRAVDYIVEAQHAAGGWRYSPGQPGDTSVFGWQIMALRSAQMAELHVPEETIRRAVDYLDSAQADGDGGQYRYFPGRGRRRGGGTPAMSAEGLLCRQYTGWPKSHGGLQAGVEYLMGHLPEANRPHMYYWYYATQTLHHMGGPEWGRWNDVMREILIQTQETTGHQTGSWTPKGGHSSAGGRIYMTALAVCTLEVYYRHSKLYSD